MADVTRIEKIEECYHLRIDSRSGITVSIGQYTSGWFICLPNYDVRTKLSASIRDNFLQLRTLIRAGLNEIDVVTTTEVLPKVGIWVSELCSLKFPESKFQRAERTS